MPVRKKIKSLMNSWFSLDKQKMSQIIPLIIFYYLFSIIIIQLFQLEYMILNLLLFFLPVLYMAIIADLKYSILTNILFLCLIYSYDFFHTGISKKENLIQIIIIVLFSLVVIFMISHYRRQYLEKQSQLKNSMKEIADSYKNLETTQSKLMALTWITNEILEVQEDKDKLVNQLLAMLNRYLLYKNIAYISIKQNDIQVKDKIGFKEIGLEDILNKGVDVPGEEIVIKDYDDNYKIVQAPLKEGDFILILHETEWIEEQDKFILDILTDHIRLLFRNIELLANKKRLAITDSGTDLYNQRFFYKKLEEIFTLTKKEGKIFSVAIFDIDNFKKINDKYGHLVGDKILEQVGEILSNNVRADDVVARYGGDEFVLLLPATPAEVAYRISTRICSLINNRIFNEDDKCFKISISGGITTYPGEKVQKPVELVKKADQALYRAKNQGKNRIIKY